MKMKNLLSTLLIFLFSCNSPEKHTREKQIQDSLYKVQKEKMFAALEARKKAQDSLFRKHDSIYFEKFKKNSKAYSIYKEHPEWGTQACLRLSEKQIWIGMALEMLKYLRGLPNHVNVSDYGHGEEYQWCWDNYTPSCFYGKSDGIITSYN